MSPLLHGVLGSLVLKRNIDVLPALVALIIVLPTLLPAMSCAGGFNGSLQHRAQPIGRAFEAQGLSGTLVQTQGDLVEVGLGEGREVGSFREVLSQQAVGALVAAPLPGASGIAEVDLYVRRDGKAL